MSDDLAIPRGSGSIHAHMECDDGPVRRPAMTAPLFCDVSLAARIDRAEARMCAEFARLVALSAPGSRVTTIPIAGGLAVYAGPGAPMNKVIGVGLGDHLDIYALEMIESEW